MGPDQQAHKVCIMEHFRRMLAGVRGPRTGVELLLHLSNKSRRTHHRRGPKRTTNGMDVFPHYFGGGSETARDVAVTTLNIDAGKPAKLLEPHGH
jgi:hypothetical protein